jgi:protoporphyrinogen oxidase
MSLERGDVLIVGAGITGVAVGRLLQKAGVSDFVILEKEQTAGGLCRSVIVDGHVLDIGGGHLLGSKYQEAYDFIFSHIPQTDFNLFDRVSKIHLNGQLIDYPVEYSLWQLPLESRIKYLISCIQAAGKSAENSPRDFEEWVRQRLGDAIADDYMIPYNRKIWGVEPTELDVDWLQKIPAYDAEQIVRSCLDHSSFTQSFPSHQTFMYPRKGGFQSLFDAIMRPVKDHIRLSTPLTSLRRQGDHLIVNERYAARLVVNTIPWSVLHTATQQAPAVGEHIQKLVTSSLAVTLHEAAYDDDTQWTYMPDPGLAHHREFYIRNFAPHSAPNGVFRETNLRRFLPTRDALFTYVNEHAYPIPVRGHANAANAVWSAYADFGVIGVGRWGQHRYYNSDVCIREAIRMTSAYLDGGVRAAIDAMTSDKARVLT